MANEYFCLEIIIQTHEASFIEGYANSFSYGGDLRKKAPHMPRHLYSWSPMVVVFFERFMCSVFAGGCVSRQTSKV